LKRAPKLVILLIGENPASLIYVNRKIKACQELGFDCQLDQRIDKENYNAEKIVEIVGKYNSDKKVDGIIVQMPLPEGIEPNKVLEAIDPQKDVDGLSPVSYGKIALGLDFEYFQPCTANGVVKMLEYYKLPIAGKCYRCCRRSMRYSRAHPTILATRAEAAFRVLGLAIIQKALPWRAEEAAGNGGVHVLRVD
jgi:5,10-methylene-tetrahydrofolate dehydrogenase/methenyl tetrahydrofolate cyclohydrolase